jgi:hypothetical protein
MNSDIIRGSRISRIYGYAFPVFYKRNKTTVQPSSGKIYGSYNVEIEESAHEAFGDG